MARFTRTVAQLLATPRILGAELERFKSDRRCEIPATSRDAIASTVLTAVRHALRTGESEVDLAPRATALATDIRDLVPALHAHAKAAAKLKGHQSASDAEGRAHRFVEWLTGGRRYDERSRVDWSCPAVMLPLVPYSTQVSAKSQLALLCRLSVLAGIQDAPARFPTYERLIEMVLELDAPIRADVARDRDVVEAAKARVTTALSTYRTARDAMLAAAADDEERLAALRAAYAPCPKPPVGRAVHVGVHEEVHALLRQDGLVPEEMSPFEILRAVNPALAQDCELWRDGPGQQQSPSFREQCEDALIRVGGWAVTARRLGEFRAAKGLDDLFAVSIETEQRVKLSPRAIREARARGEDPEQLSVQRISLLEALVEAAAVDSLSRSSVAAENVPLNADGKAYLIYSLYATCSRIWSMTEALYAGTAGQRPEDAHRWALASANWTHLLNELKSRKLKGEYVKHAKNKKKLIRLVTLPQLVCVAFPLRRRELRALKARWQDARMDALAKGHNANTHRGVLAAKQAYIAQAVRHMMLAITLNDGMRRQQYTFGRLGQGKHFSPRWVRRGGRANGAIEGIAGMQTNWTGEMSDPAHLKIRERNERLDSREGRDLCPGVVDMEILWDVISVHRPEQLVSAGLLASVDDYDLEADMREGRWALFPSGKRVKRADQSRTDMSVMVGRELHYLTRTYLRPAIDGEDQIPAWDDLDREWKSLWAQHACRLFNGSFWGGNRGEWRFLEELCKDTEATLKEKYSVVNAHLEDKLGLNTAHWEHPHAYDAWMDRLVKNREVMDPLDDPTLPLPPHVQVLLDQQRAEGRRRRPAGSRVRVREARPDQAPPSRLPRVEGGTPKRGNIAVR